MNVFVLGATGFIGRSLVLRLLHDGHRPIAWVRDPSAARSRLGDQVELVPVGAGDTALDQALGRSHAVVNLAGASIAKRWTERVRQDAFATRVGITERLVAALARCKTRPGVLVNGSAVGIYGDRGDAILDESAAPGSGTLAELCVAWEHAAATVRDLGLRLVCLRTGAVLATDGGALGPLLTTTRLGLGTTFGAGDQFMSWIHRHDLLSMLTCAISDERWHGPMNGTAPHPASNRELVDALASALGRPRLLRVPAMALRLALGDASELVLASQRAVPRRALEAGFTFTFPELVPALADLVHALE